MSHAITLLGLLALVSTFGCSGAATTRLDGPPAVSRTPVTGQKTSEPMPTPARIAPIKHPTGGSRGKNGK